MNSIWIYRAAGTHSHCAYLWFEARLLNREWKWPVWWGPGGHIWGGDNYGDNYYLNCFPDKDIRTIRDAFGSFNADKIKFGSDDILNLLIEADFLAIPAIGLDETSDIFHSLQRERQRYNRLLLEAEQRPPYHHIICQPEAVVSATRAFLAWFKCGLKNLYPLVACNFIESEEGLSPEAMPELSDTVAPGNPKAELYQLIQVFKINEKENE